MNQVRKVFLWLIYSNVFIALCAVALVFTNELSIGGEIVVNKAVGFVFFSTLFTYTTLKSRPSAAGHEPTEHEVWTAQHGQLWRNILLISLLGGCAFFLSLPVSTMLMVAVLGALTLLYGFLPLPFTKPAKKLRDFGLLKTLLVAVVWSFSTVVVPLADVYVAPDVMGFLLLRRFLFVLSLTLVFEIKDLKHDERYALETVPMRLGVSNTKLLAQLILFLLMSVILVQYFVFDISLVNMIAVQVSLLISVFCIQPLTEETKPVWYYFVLDGMMILQFVLVYAATKFFE